MQSKEEAVLDVLVYGHENANVFTGHAGGLIATLAAQAAVAIETVRLREKVTLLLAEKQKAELRQKDVAEHLGELASIVESS